MATNRCYCACHQYPGTYPPPCGFCGHDTREGRWVGGYRGWWEPNADPRDDEITRLTAQLAALEAERDALAAENETAWQTLARERDSWQAEADKLTSERDAAVARADRAEKALVRCTLALEYRDGVTCREERDKGVCLNHRVIEGLRVHAVTADRLEIENRALRRQVRATYGIIHEGLHGGRATDPEGQATCERPSCRNARAALAASSAEGEGA